VTAPLGQRDFMVVAPYNAQVRSIRRALEAAGLGDVPVGTVDKFQGREAAVVFYSMATSSAEDVTRSLEFLFSRNRLNVAVSQAMCLACIVASPRLLESRARTIEQMRLINALCRFVEMAEIDLSTTWHIDENPLGYYAAAVSDTLRTITAWFNAGKFEYRRMDTTRWPRMASSQARQSTVSWDPERTGIPGCACHRL
jgi:hypothetical protein